MAWAFELYLDEQSAGLVRTVSDPRQWRDLDEGTEPACPHVTLGVAETIAESAVKELLPRWSTAEKNAMHMQSHESIITLGGGIQGIRCQSIHVTSRTVTIHSFVSAWSKIAQSQPDGPRMTATPHNNLDTRETLTNTSTGQWQVSQLAWHFNPKTAP